MTKLAAVPGQNVATLAETVSDSDWVKGNRDAEVVLIEYSDLQCPACAYYAPVIEALAEEFGDRIAIVYRHFPLPQHQNARLAAYATEAAGRQGKFWEMVDIIFFNQDEWKNSNTARELFLNYARNLNLNLEAFQQDLDSTEIKERVENQYLSGIQSRVNATPTFFLNGEKVLQPNELRNLINQKLTLTP